ncbi:glycosyltransferase family 4 protein [Brumimicrobium aurantiacum]|uniref:Glycosyltransferase n=1 Tax=Brumimicrobium aurantiacum TaxID=1737063 RepID=A0A3E1F0Q8_9FLAO|nr:glycosyltransferase family 4 protein [Brumimicrobium aurantiacum]RFC55323.1 glycosyltransferase [Brumimicrobium aurantiacum]
MILHITNDFAHSKVYKNLVANLDENGLKQTIYTPVKNENSVGGNFIELKQKESKIIYSNILNMHIDRIVFPLKINKIYKDILTKVDFKNIKLIHAHTWYSDGAVALKLNKKYNIPYIIAVRGSDLNQFWKLPHLKNKGLEILKNASKVILITPRYQERLLALDKIKRLDTNFIEKTKVITNGLDPYWINHVKDRKTKIDSPIKLLFIGVFSEAKNTLNLVKAVNKLVEQGVNCELNLVGGGGSCEKKVLALIDNKAHIKFHGKIYAFEKLEQLFAQAHIYGMTSIRETFGLVYGEALSQGLPVLYSKNEGIDGVFNENIGVAVNPYSITSISEGIKSIIENYDSFDFDPEKIAQHLNWKSIAQRYIDLYNEQDSKTNP